ncbi:MAG: phosphoglycerate dehydrogenase [Minicystis sp.]
MAAGGPKDPAPVAVCSRSFSNHPALRALVQERYANVRFNETGATLSGEALVRFLDDAEKAIVGMERIDAAILEQVPRLRVVAKYGVGLDALDLGALAARGVRLGWRPGVNAGAVAELTVCFAIALLRGLPAASGALRAGAWRPRIGREMAETTFGIVGCGHIGRQVVRLLRPFGGRVLAHDIVDQSEFYREHGVEAVSLEALLAASDVVSLHVPLDDSTRGLMSAERIDRMRAGACLVNTARGGLVDEQHLARRLGEGRLGGAAFDVFAEEPPASPAYAALLGLPSFIGTPHVAGTSERAVLAMGRAAIDGLDDHDPPLDRDRSAAAGPR